MNDFTAQTSPTLQLDKQLFATLSQAYEASSGRLQCARARQHYNWISNSLARWLRHLKRKVTDFNAHELGKICNWLSSCLPRWLKHLKPDSGRLHRARASQHCNLINSCLPRWLVHLKRKVDDFSAQAIANIACAFTKSDHPDAQFFTALASVATTRLDTFNARKLANTA